MWKKCVNLAKKKLAFYAKTALSEKAASKQTKFTKR